MNLPFLQNYSLVGGTALALQYGHRESVDTDFAERLAMEILYNTKYRVRKMKTFHT